MNKIAGAIAAVAMVIGTSAFAAQSSAVTAFSNCNESSLAQMKQSVDTIKDPAKKEAAAAELDTAVSLMRDNKPDECLVHLTNASKFVTP
jgi:hypothetical protein